MSASSFWNGAPSVSSSPGTGQQTSPRSGLVSLSRSPSSSPMPSKCYDGRHPWIQPRALSPPGFTLGEHAVNGFFAISGFLVTMSFDRRGWRDYAIARTLRIAPGLIVAVLAVSLLLSAAMTALASSTNTCRARACAGSSSATLTSFKSNIALPGVFADNPFTFPDGNRLDPQIRGHVLRRAFSSSASSGLLRLPLAVRRRSWPGSRSALVGS